MTKSEKTLYVVMGCGVGLVGILLIICGISNLYRKNLQKSKDRDIVSAWVHAGRPPQGELFEAFQEYKKTKQFKINNGKDKSQSNQVYLAKSFYDLYQKYNSSPPNELAKSLVYNDLIKMVKNKEVVEWQVKVKYIWTKKGAKDGIFSDGISIYMFVPYANTNFEIEFYANFGLDSHFVQFFSKIKEGEWIIINGSIINPDRSWTESGQMRKPEFKIKLISVRKQ